MTIAAHRPNAVVEHYTEPDVVSCDTAVPGFRLPVVDVFG
jgi:hypothetical protein